MGGRQGAAGGEKKGRGRPFWGAFRAAFCGRPAQGAKGRGGGLLFAYLCGIIKKQPYFEGESRVRFRPLCLSRKAQRQGASSGAFARSGCTKGRQIGREIPVMASRKKWLPAVLAVAVCVAVACIFAFSSAPGGETVESRHVKRGDFKGRGLDDFEGAGA